MCEHILGGRDIYGWRQEAETQAHEVERLRDDLDLALDLLSELASAIPRSDPRGPVMGHVKEAEALLRRLLAERKHKRVPVPRREDES